MSGKPSRGHTKRISSRISRFKNRVSSVFSPSSQGSRLADDDTGRLGIPTHHAEDRLPSASTSHRQSISNISLDSNVNHIPAHPSASPLPFARHLKESASQNHSSTHLAPPSPLQPPQEQVLTSPNTSPHSQYLSSGILNQAHNFVMKDPVFIDNNTVVDNFMEKFLQHTIIGAEFDSSDRDPPPRCHPGTRLTIIQRCLDFILKCSDEEKLRWVVGPAGAGKSAIMQIVAEKAPDGVICASVFLSVNGREDGTKTIVTIAYQLAVKYEPYRRFIQNEITRDPSLLRKSLSVHFKRFIVEPFIHRHLFSPSDRILIIIDGLDECDDPRTQRELLRLITDFCIKYPLSPVVWMVASRPEPHITSFFEKPEIQPTFTKEKIVIDSDEACEDVERYLRAQLKKIKFEYAPLKRKQEWPAELEFTRIATAAGGLFAYASTVIRYIDDPHYGDPAAQLRYVLEVIDAGGVNGMLQKDHPMAQLDALYARILSNIPDNVMVNARKLLLLYSSLGWHGETFRTQCNVLGLTEDAAYGAVRHLHAVAKIPEPDNADDEPLLYLHKSFEDFLFDPKRSGFSGNAVDEVKDLKGQVSWRIIEEVSESDGLAHGKCIGLGDGSRGGHPVCCDDISLSWPGDERFRKTDHELRHELHTDAKFDMCRAFSFDSNFYQSMSCFNLLTTRFTAPTFDFPFNRLRDSVFDQFREELTDLGKLREVPLRALDYAAICGDVELRFTSPIGVDVTLPDRWIESCNHEKRELDGLQHWQGWTTSFGRFGAHDSDSEDEVVTEDGMADTDIPRLHFVAGKGDHHGLWKNARGMSAV
ncbi:hypothetical protein AGABI1DRAFT_131622 [Agaricus bisporus var. burnettii JB137-S8]|uniref:NACHT domain-containing protein n=1 Tax=Agaricus bisporus var. burnettii (strain JB137-S8 / ATCC MYA-4627 / FGSC 10392) TaxID=597362 RepID=K5WLF9_AGABU|nr:uncharacterized protein AGABI1DRAFT_131622 [Agaricus bisporus var. burnettii JB137-S8]EKM76106.1 hypothetical protein AGABI1DRAFT_131622 [Agaricus bisporus var. burnettii JB137-S8]